MVRVAESTGCPKDEHMHLERIDPRGLDDATADHLAALMNASMEATGQRRVPMTGANVAAQAAYSHDDRPFDAMWLAYEDDDVVGTASLELDRWDNDHMGMVFCTVHPAYWRRGIGTALLDAQAGFAREQDRSLLLTFGNQGTPAEALKLEYGFEVAQQMAQRRLYPRQIDVDRIAGMVADAEKMSEDYELVRLDGAAPDEWLGELVDLFEAINDAPTDAMEVQPDSFPVERIRRYESAMAHRRQHLYRLMARHKETGAWAGHTIVCVDEHCPGFAMQEDTSVVSAHRGHRLGMLLKATMLLWLRDAQPTLETIDTWNALSNRHMIAVNDELGCVVEAHGAALQLHL
jgi:GNAT superfamily N-acetyltransferase